MSTNRPSILEDDGKKNTLKINSGGGREKMEKRLHTSLHSFQNVERKVKDYLENLEGKV